jgi:cell division protein FtsB
VLPDVVKTNNDEMHTLSLSYGVAALVAAITTARKVVDHEKEIAQLKNRVKALEDENKMLKTKLIA